MSLAVVRSLHEVRRPSTPEELDDLEQELVDQYALAGVSAGVGDASIAAERAVIFEFVRYLGHRVWMARTEDADRFLAYQRRELRRAHGTVRGKALVLARFYEFVLARYQGEIHAATGCVVEQVIDEFNKPARPGYRLASRIPPSQAEVEELFRSWGASLPDSRKYLTAARDYLAASLWRRAGLRIAESVHLDIRDWRPDLGELGKLHVRFGKGSRGRGPKPRLVPAINGVGELLNWWLSDVRHQFGGDYDDPDAPLLPSERCADGEGRCLRVGGNALRTSLIHAVDRWLPAWSGRMSPHVLRHYCASSLYARGMDLKAIQELLGHEWLATTTRYIHVHETHIEEAWHAANERTLARLGQAG